MKALAQNTLIQNRYLIIHLIGKGGMGEVYLAVDQRLGSAVALKRTYFAGDEMLGSAFEREARILARMRHPVLPKVSDHFSEGEEQFLVMEHIAGDDLAKRLEVAKKPFPTSWVLFWADQLLDALSYLHSNEPPIIHRDIKPQNLKLTDENHIILLDFGLSKSSTGQTHISRVGSTGSVVGYTPHYAPMEQIRGIGTNPKSDLYSLSATLYQLMTNTVPADALSRADALLNEMPDPIRPLNDLNPEISPAVSEVILKGMEVSQEKRFSTAREMQKVLRRAFSQVQEAMTAQTVAFNLNDNQVGAIEAPIGASLPTAEAVDISGMDSKANEISYATSVAGRDGAASLNGADEVDFDATLRYEPVIDAEEDGSFGGNSLSGRDDFYSEQDGDAEAGTAMPVVSFDNDAAYGESVSSAQIHNSFATVVTTTQPVNSVAAAAATPVSHVSNAAPRKSSSGMFAVVGGIAALVLLLAAGAGGWYAYNNFYAGVSAVETAPLIEEPAMAEPSPEPSTEMVVIPETSAPESDNSNTNASVSDVADETSPANREPGTTQRPATQVRNSPPKTSSSTGVKPTPKPKTSDERIKILQ